MSRKLPFSPTHRLRVVLRNARIENEPARIFLEWPALCSIALQYTRFVSPFIEIEIESGGNLLQSGFHDAVRRFREAGEGDSQSAIHAVVAAFATRADVLCQLRMLVYTRDGGWVVWNYDEPLIALIFLHERTSVQMRDRET